MERLTFEEKIKQAEAREANMTGVERLELRLKGMEEETSVREGRVSKYQVTNIVKLEEQVTERVIYQS